MASLQNRLTWGLALSLSLLLALQWAVVSVALGRLTQDQLAARLQHEGESLLAGLAFDRQGRLQLDERRVSPSYQRPFSGYYYVVESSRERRPSRSLWDAELALDRMQPVMARLAGPEGQRLLVVTRSYRKDGQALRLAVAQDMGALQAALRQFQLAYGVISGMVLLLLLAVQRLIVRGSLASLAAVRDDMGRLARGEIAAIAAPGPHEIAPLIAELNRLLAGMERRARRSREALGNLAHALKTRLALLNQVAEQPQLAVHDELRDAIYQSTDAIGRVVERELKRARLLGEALPGRHVDLPEVLYTLRRTLQMLYAAKAPLIEIEVAPAAHFVGDQEDLLEMLGNLLDNACQWCARRVRLEVGEAAGSAIFVVEDDGPGCPEGRLEDLTRRGFRLDESRPGSGLGLAIVHDIVESYAGELAFARSARLGGLRVEVRLPQPGR